MKKTKAGQSAACDIIIVAGQSNAEGCGAGPAERPFEPDGRVQVMSQKENKFSRFKFADPAERVWAGKPCGNFWLPFVREYVESGRLRPGRGLLIVQAAVGGTGFADHRWGPEDDLYINMLKMIKAALALNLKNELKALLWHQGETDCGTDEQTHAAHLETLLRGVREKFGVPALPFVAGDFVQHWKRDNPGHTESVVAAIRSVCGSAGSAAFVETDGLLSNDEVLGGGDNIHFSRAALEKLGRRYFEAYQNLTMGDAS